MKEKQNKQKNRLPKKLRDDILWRDKHQCQYPATHGFCGAIEILCIHHVDGDETNNKKSNLVALCRLHHNQTTADTKYAKRIIRNLQQKLKQYGTEQLLLDLE